MSGPLFTVSAPPHWHSGRLSRQIFWESILALSPVLVMAVIGYGLPAVRVLALAGAAAVVMEAVCERLQGRELDVDNGHALLTGLVFACLLPAAAPWWLVLVGVGVAIGVGKHVFGGLGTSPVVPALLGYAVCQISWPGLLRYDFVQLDSLFSWPLADLKYYGRAAAEAHGYADLLLGRQLGGLGASQAGAALLGGLFLVARGIVPWRIPVFFLAGLAASAFAYQLAYPDLAADPLFHLLAGSTLFAAFFLAPEMACAPVGRTAMAGYGLLAGVLVMIIRAWGVWPEGTSFAILLANLTTPLWDRIRPRAFGKGRA
jgi:electron transport complex protein RnfD